MAGRTQLLDPDRFFGEDQAEKERCLTTAERLLLELLSCADKGSLSITLPGGTRFDAGSAAKSSPAASACFYSQEAIKRVLRGGSLALGETYAEGQWDVKEDNILDFIGFVLLNDLEAKIKHSLRLRLKLAWNYVVNSPLFLSAARRCVQTHYDLGNELFQLMLDPTMTYSCGYQKDAADSLEKMQEQKYELIARKLGLAQGGTMIDIGCGWGGMLLHAAKNYPDLRGKGITLSEGQYEFAAKRLQQAGVADRFKVELCDYRNVDGLYDYVVSIGMFEHVGKASYGRFMKKIDSLLKPEGKGLLHTIAVPDAPSVKPDAFTNTYIFPGSRLPRLDELTREMRRAKFVVAHIDNLKLHYAETLRRWKVNFDRNRSKIRMLNPNKYNEAFMRIWNYYLQSCEAGFRYGTMHVYQLLFCKDKRWPFPMRITA